MIGVFDSGLGCVLTATYIERELPGVPLLVFADQAYLPYGSKSGSRIRHRTFTCLHWLFEHGCSMVIMACNTASTHAIVERQARYPDKKVLSVTIPGVEAVVERDLHAIAILSTPSTCEQQLYSRMFAKHYADYPLETVELSGEGLVDLIEQGASSETVRSLLASIAFPDGIDGLILGCTHYPLIENDVRSLLPKECAIINPGQEAAKKLVEYFERHPSLADQTLGFTGEQTRVVTTGSADQLAILSNRLMPHTTHGRDCLEIPA